MAAHNYIGGSRRRRRTSERGWELHDQTAQSLVAISHREQMLKRYLSDEAEALLSELREMTMQAIDDLRRIIRAMRPTYGRA